LKDKLEEVVLKQTVFFEILSTLPADPLKFKVWNTSSDGQNVLNRKVCKIFSSEVFTISAVDSMFELDYCGNVWNSYSRYFAVYASSFERPIRFSYPTICPVYASLFSFSMEIHRATHQSA
jgi:hypothetical protein